MKLMNSIVILEGEDTGSRVIDLVLLVKHPEGCDPIECIRKGMHEYLKGGQTEAEQPQADPAKWGDLLRSMQSFDWSSQGLFIEVAPLWTVINDDQKLFYGFLIPA